MSEPHGYQRFFAELKRRRVFRVAAVYGATAFVVVQVADVLQEALLLPGAFLSGVAVLALLGFPIAIVLAWAYERTPEGVVRTGAATTQELADIVAQPASRRWPSGLLALVGIVALAAAAWLTLVRGPSAGGDGAATPADAVAEAPGPTRRAVAVLPFSDLAGTEDSRVFALGLHDDLMTQLTQIPELKVTSRTSVMAYADQGRPVAEIARELGVGSIVEGGVRTAGGRVRLNVQLVDPATDEHLWAQTFDEELTAENVFEIQGEIARAVAAALEAELSDKAGQALGTVQTDNIEAWGAYHRGRAIEDGARIREEEIAAVRAFEQAVELDPGFVAAWASLVRAQSWLVRSGFETDTMPAARSVEQLRKIDPGGADALFAEGLYRYYAQADYPAALEALQQARKLRPGDPEILQHEGWVLRRMGRWREAMERLERAIQLDPRNATLLWNQAGNHYRLRSYDTGRMQFELSLDIDPGSGAGGRLLEAQLFSEGDSAAARQTFDAGRGFAPPGERESAEFWLAYVARDYRGAIDAALRMTGEAAEVPSASGSQRFQSRPLRLAVAYRLIGDPESARAWADSAVVQAEAALETRPVPVPRDKFGVASVAHSHLGLALALRGGPGDVEQGIEHAKQGLRLHDFEHDAADSSVGNWLLLRTYTVAGQTDDAIRTMDVMLSRPSFFGLGDVKLDPLYDRLRGDPRYEGLIRKAEGLIEW